MIQFDAHRQQPQKGSQDIIDAYQAACACEVAITRYPASRASATLTLLLT